jgi:hypothetical protein
MLRVTLVLTVALSMASVVVHADGLDDLVQRANALRRVGRDDEALALLERAWRETSSPRIRAQMGFAAQALGRWLDADTHLRAALASPDAWVNDRRAIVEDALRTVERHIAMFDVRCEVPNAILHVEGREALALPLSEPLRMEAGVVRYEVRAEGHVPARRTSQLSAGMLTRDEVMLVPTPPSHATAGTVWHSQRVVALATTVGAAISLGVGVAALFVRNVAATRWNAAFCLRGDRTRAENCEPERVTAERAGAVSAAGFAVGAALAITAAALWLTVPSGRRTSAVLCAPSTGGLTCEGRF